MHDVILGILDDPVADPSLEDEHNGRFALDVEATDYLDGERIYHGKAAGYVETQQEDIFVIDNEDGVSIETETEERDERVVTEFYADLETGFIGVGSNDGKFLFEELGLWKDARVYETGIDLEEFIKHVDAHNGICWGYGCSTEDDSDDLNGDARINWHASAGIEDARRADDVVQFAFSYKWGTGHARGMVAESGYAAIYKDWPVEEFGRWLRDDLLPHAGLEVREGETEEQQTLEESADEVAADGGDGE